MWSENVCLPSRVSLGLGLSLRDVYKCGGVCVCVCVCMVKVCACLWSDCVCKSVCMCGCSRCVYLYTRVRLNVVTHLFLYEGRVFVQGLFTDICLRDYVHRSACVSLWGECMHICAQMWKECFLGCVRMGVCVHLCAVNVPSCALWGSHACKSQRRQLAERDMTCL